MAGRSNKHSPQGTFVDGTGKRARRDDVGWHKRSQRVPTYRFLQRICHTPGMAFFAASRDALSLGTLARLFWNPAKAMNVPPLHERDSEQLFEAAADYFALRDLDLDEFREKVLESARGNPGQIIEMCRLAAQPQYHAGRYIKFAPLRIDTVMKFAP